jgi:hypothetical protein
MTIAVQPYQTIAKPPLTGRRSIGDLLAPLEQNRRAFAEPRRQPRGAF